MQELWGIYLFVLLVSSPTLGRVEAAALYDVMNYGAKGSGQADDSQVQFAYNNDVLLLYLFFQ